MSAPQNNRLGILLITLSCVVFTIQDSMSRHLGGAAGAWMVVAVRYWAFALVVVLLALRQARRHEGGLRAAVATRHPWLQLLRGLLLVADIFLMITAFVHLGLIGSHAVFAAYPLLVTALSVPILGEKVGWRRWLAVAAGFTGVLIILEPGGEVFSLSALLPFFAALSYAAYGVLTRLVSREDSASVSFFWTGVIGAVIVTPMGLMHWAELGAADWAMMIALCCTAMIGHYLVIWAFGVAEASVAQPFAYLQLPMVTILGVLAFGEVLRSNVVIGACVVVGAGVFTIWRQRVREKAR